MAEPVLYDTVDFLYNMVMANMPDTIQQHEQASAFALGAAGIFGVIKGIQSFSKYYIDNLIDGFHDRWLPVLEEVGVYGMAASPIIYYWADPAGVSNILDNHQTYLAGMTGVHLSSIGTALYDLKQRRSQKRTNQGIYAPL